MVNDPGRPAPPRIIVRAVIKPVIIPLVVIPWVVVNPIRRPGWIVVSKTYRVAGTIVVALVVIVPSIIVCRVYLFFPILPRARSIPPVFVFSDNLCIATGKEKERRT